MQNKISYEQRIFKFSYVKISRYVIITSWYGGSFWFKILGWVLFYFILPFKKKNLAIFIIYQRYEKEKEREERNIKLKWNFTVSWKKVMNEKKN